MRARLADLRNILTLGWHWNNDKRQLFNLYLHFDGAWRNGMILGLENHTCAIKNLRYS